MGSFLSVIRRDNRRDPHFRIMPTPPESGPVIDRLQANPRFPRTERPKGSSHKTTAKTGKPARSFAARHGVIDPRGIS